MKTVIVTAIVAASAALGGCAAMQSLGRAAPGLGAAAAVAGVGVSLYSLHIQRAAAATNEAVARSTLDVNRAQVQLLNEQMTQSRAQREVACTNHVASYGRFSSEFCRGFGDRDAQVVCVNIYTVSQKVPPDCRPFLRRAGYRV